MFLRTFLNVHVHASTFAQVEGADVNLAADKLEREAMAGNQQSRFAWTGNRDPRSLKLVEIGTNGRPGRGGSRKGWHGKAPNKLHRPSDTASLPVEADDGEGLSKLVRL